MHNPQPFLKPFLLSSLLLLFPMGLDPPLNQSLISLHHTPSPRSRRLICLLFLFSTSVVCPSLCILSVLYSQSRLVRSFPELAGLGKRENHNKVINFVLIPTCRIFWVRIEGMENYFTHKVVLCLCYSSKVLPQHAPGMSLWSSEQRKWKPKHWLWPGARGPDLKAQSLEHTLVKGRESVHLIHSCLQCLEERLPWTWCSVTVENLNLWQLAS